MHHPVRIVPDLSLIDYNDSSDLKYDLKSAQQLNRNQRVNAEPSSAKPVHNENKEATDSYVAWRTKNAHLFNKSASSFNQNPNTYQAKNTINNQQRSNEKSTLLDKITEISERLEREDINDEINLESDQHRYNDSTAPSVNCKGHDTKFYKNDDNYGRVKELYDRIFPSEKLKSYNCDNGFPVGENFILNGEQHFQRSDNRNVIGENVNHSFVRENSFAPKKKVTYECDDMTRGISPGKYGGDYVSTMSSRCNQDSCVSNLNDNNEDGEFHNSVINQSNNRHIPLHPNYDYKKHGPCNGNSPMGRSVIVYDYEDPKYSFERQKSSERKSLKKYYDPRISENNRNDVCLCPQCPKNDESKDSVKRYKDNHRNYYHKKPPSESNSSCDDSPMKNKHCCYEKYKKKKKKITVDELYKIVKLQNEQINLLQKQIDRLLEQNYNLKKTFESNQITQKIPPPNGQLQGSVDNKCSCQNNNSDKFTTQGFTFSVVQENSKIEQQNFDGTNSNIKKCTNVSIGVMTSFVELTQKIQGVAPQSNTGIDTNKRNDCLPVTISDRPDENRKDLCPGQRWKKSIDSPAARFGRESSCPAVAEESFTLNEVDLPALPVLVNEHVPTPQSSVHVDIQDYGTTSTSSGNSDSESDHSSENEGEGKNLSEDEKVGWTLYDNVVGQVNKILQRSGPRNETANSAVPEIDDVRYATIQQLRRLGVSFIDHDSSAVKKVTFNPVFNGASKNVATKANRFHHTGTEGFDTNLKSNENPLDYLNEEEILQAAINIMNKKKGSPTADIFPSDNASPMHDNNDVSFATMKYLERYRLIPSGSNNKEKPTQSRPMGSTKKQKRHKVSQQHQQLPLNEQQEQFKLQYDQRRLQQLQYNEQRPQNLLSNKILDITALKQQPKLL